jgi:hypothetical protein
VWEQIAVMFAAEASGDTMNVTSGKTGMSVGVVSLGA